MGLFVTQLQQVDTGTNIIWNEFWIPTYFLCVDISNVYGAYKDYVYIQRDNCAGTINLFCK